MANQQNLTRHNSKRTLIRALIITAAILTWILVPNTGWASSVNRTRIGEFGFYDGQFNTPSALAPIGSSVLVVDTLNRRIQRLVLPSGTPEYSFKSIKDADGDPANLENPVDIAVDPLRGIFVCDSGAAQIVMFDVYGEYQKTIGSFGGIGVRFNEPVAIGLDQYGMLYVVDRKTQRIVKCDVNGKQVLQVTQSEGNLSSPRDIWIQPDGSFFVLDNHGIKHYNELGKFISIRASLANGERFTCDPTGRFWVTVPKDKKVLLLNKSGQTERVIAVPEAIPLGIAWIQSTVYITDIAHHQLVSIRDVAP